MNKNKNTKKIAKVEKRDARMYITSGTALVVATTRSAAAAAAAATVGFMVTGRENDGGAVGS